MTTIGTITTLVLNVRALPTTHSRIIGRLRYGQQVTIESANHARADGHSWHLILWNGGPAYIAAEFVRLAAPVRVSHKIGIHVYPPQGNQNYDAVAMAAQLARAGKPLASVTVINDIGLANRFVGLVQTVILRVGVGNSAYPDYPNSVWADPYNQGVDWMNRLRPLYAGAHASIFIQPINEWNTFTPVQSAFTRGLIDNAGGRKLALVAASYGQPEGGDPAGTWARTYGDVLQYAAGKGHILCLHVASKPGTPENQLSGPNDLPWYELRYRMFNSPLPIVFGEALPRHSPDPAGVITRALAFNNLVMGDSTVLGFDLWSANPEGVFEDDSINAALDELGRRILVL